MSDLPEPLVPADVDLSSLEYMPLNVARLLASDTWAVSTGDEAKAAMTLWCYAWHQTPAGSIPDDERVLAVRSGAGGKWKKVREVALRGFVRCSDGRLYHRVICEQVMVAVQKRAHWRKKKQDQRGGNGGGHDGAVPGDIHEDNAGTNAGHGVGNGVTGRDGTGSKTLEPSSATSPPSAAREDFETKPDAGSFEGVPEADDPTARAALPAAVRNPRPNGRTHGPKPIGAILTGATRLKPQDRADEDMRRFLTGNLGRPLAEAVDIVASARDPTREGHAEALRLVTKISAENRLGWFHRERAA